MTDPESIAIYHNVCARLAAQGFTVQINGPFFFVFHKDDAVAKVRLQSIDQLSAFNDGAKIVSMIEERKRNAPTYHHLEKDMMQLPLRDNDHTRKVRRKKTKK